MTDTPPEANLVHVDSTHEFHRGMYKTLDLLKIETITGPVFFIVEGCSKMESDALNMRYFYEEHTCPTNFCRVEAIFTPTDNDPHEVFEYVRSVWMPKRYIEDSNRDAILRELFPETLQP